MLRLRLETLTSIFATYPTSCFIWQKKIFANKKTLKSYFELPYNLIIIILYDEAITPCTSITVNMRGLSIWIKKV